MSESTVMPCGLYRTTIALPEHGDAVAAGILVRFHNHSEEGPPVVMLPHSNRNNRWHFHGPGYHIRDQASLDSLSPLLSEGFYYLSDHFHPDEEHVVPERGLVQLGYDRHGAPIIFFPSVKKEENALEFPRQGMKITATVYKLLVPLDIRGPRVPPRIH